MKFHSIFVQSFRSVVEQTIKIENNCIALIGLNESGKTNILNAINHLDRNEKFTIKDISKISNQPPIIHYLFDIDELEREAIKLELEESLLNKHNFVGEYTVIESLEMDKITIIKELVESEDGSGYKDSYRIVTDYKVHLNNEYRYFDSNEEIELAPIVFEDEEHNAINSYIHSALLSPDLIPVFSSIDDLDFDNDINKILTNIISEMLPNVNYWEFDSKSLLPSEMSYEAFMVGNEPYEINAPLFNMLLISDDLAISNSSDVAKKISTWKVDASTRRKDSSILTRDVNKHIKSVWDDYDQEINIDLEETKITIHVTDPQSSIMNFYDMEMRSQGFKTFISFILTVTAEVKTGILENYILILDEPETHLHPSGVKYMREELLKLASSNNHVFFATHSVFMIDRENLKRHLIVEKKKEKSVIKSVTRNNILQEDIIYQALGTSVDEFSISNRNILFEGELDVNLFSFFIDRCVPNRDNKLNDHEFLDGGGTNRILSFFLNKAIPKHSKWSLILDNDAPGRNLPDEIEKVTIPEVYKNLDFNYYSQTRDYELEDILPKSIIETAFNSAIENMVTEYQVDMNQDKTVSKIIEEYYGRNRIRGQDRGSLEQAFKESLDTLVISQLAEIEKESTYLARREKFEELLPDYYEFIVGFLARYNMDFSTPEPATE